MKLSCLVFAVMLTAPVAAVSGGDFDGSWNVVIVCANAPDGARGYTWRFPAMVHDGSLIGQYHQIGQIPSGTLSGQIQANGDAFLKMVGITGNPANNLGHLPSGMPFGYTATAHFAGGSGSGKRDQLRSCNLSFSKS